MVDKINKRTKEIEMTGIRVFANQVAQYEDGVNLTIGQPDFPTPERVKRAGIRAIETDLTGYSHSSGILELRQSVARFFEEKYNFSYHPETEIIITSGVSEAIDSVLRTILSEGDEVILPAPIFSAYEPIIHLCGAKVVYLDTSDTNFIPDPNRLKELISDKTKAIIFNYPSNPTGVTISYKAMQQLVDVLKRHDVFILSDEIYSENSYEEKHQSFAQFPELKDQLFLLHGLSKSHAMTGWRIGYVLGPEAIMEHVIKVHLYNCICASVPGQYAAIEALVNSRETPNEMNKAYIERRDYIYDRLSNMGLYAVKPAGAFYIFPSIKGTGLSSFEFATTLLEEEHVAVVPGDAFTTYGEGFIRISYAGSLQVLEEGMDRLERFMKKVTK